MSQAAPAHAKGEDRKARIAVDIAISAALVLVLFCMGSLKAGYHIDEMYTFGFSNHQYSSTNTITPMVEDGEVWSGEEFYEDYLCVSEGHFFDYANVWTNQSMDVHPPLYYVLIHTVSCLFPQLSIKWLGLLVSVPLALVVYWQLVWIAGRLGMKRWMALLLPATFILGVGYFNYAVVFFRMYGLLSVWVNFLAMVFLKYAPEQEDSAAYYLSFGLVLLGGALTQYYFLIIALLMCLVYAIAVAAAKRWRKLFASLGVAAASLGAALLIFPAAIDHIFSSYRSEQAVESATSGGLAQALLEYLGMLDDYVFGGLGAIVLVALICYAVLARRRGKIALGGSKIFQYCLLILPGCLYMLVIAKISPDVELPLRYSIPVCGLLYLAVFDLLRELAERMPQRRAAQACAVVIAVALAFAGYRNGVPYLYLDENENLEAIEEQQDAAGIYLYDVDSRWHITQSLQEIRLLDQVAFLTAEGMEDFDYEELEGDSYIVFVDADFGLDAQDALGQLMEDTGSSSCEELFETDKARVYCLE